MNKLCFYFQMCMVAITLHGVSCQVTQDPDKIAIGQLDTAIPVEGNEWFFMNPGSPQKEVYDLSGQNWTDSGLILRTYFYVHRTGELHIGLRAKTASGSSLLGLRFGDDNTEVEISNSDYEKYYAGTYQIDSTGYYHIYGAHMKLKYYP